MRDGLLGLILFLGHWLSPETGKASIDAMFLRRESQYIQFQCDFDIAWNRQLEQLVDAGIPLRFNIVHCTDLMDTVQFTRTLNCDMVNFTYSFIDSSKEGVVKSHSYKFIPLALRDFSKWNFHINHEANVCKIEVAILPGLAIQLNRVVDMSRIWGQQKVLCQFNVQDKINKSNERKREKKK